MQVCFGEICKHTIMLYHKISLCQEPLTELTPPYFQRQLVLQKEQRSLLTGAGQAYYDNDLVIAKPNGIP